MEMIVAIDERGGIARNGQIPWLGQFPEDMKFFKDTTTNHAVFMGRTTYFSLPPRFRPLRHRTNIVYTRSPENYEDVIDPSFCLFFSDEGPDAQQIANGQKMFIIGGSQIYHQFYHLCDTIWVTRIKDDYQCDTFLNMDKILSNFSLTQIVQQGEKFVIEKYTRIGRHAGGVFSGNDKAVGGKSLINKP
jgi:dihydrofolate reductase